jgi:hypothetical protein
LIKKNTDDKSDAPDAETGGNLISPAALTTQQIEPMERFVACFERSARRWEIVIYPAMFAFIVLAAYGFFLVYSLTYDMQRMARSMDTMVVSMQEMSDKLDTMDPMLSRLGSMDSSMRAMTATNDAMRHHMTVMTDSVARPMGFLSSFMPW